MVSPCFGSPKPDPIRRRNLGRKKHGRTFRRSAPDDWNLLSPLPFFSFLIFAPPCTHFSSCSLEREASSRREERYLLPWLLRPPLPPLFKQQILFHPRSILVRAIIMPEYLLYLILVLLLLTSPSPSFVPDDRNLSQKLLILAEFLADLLLLELRVRARRLLPAPHCSLHTLHCLFDQRLRRIRILSIRLKPLLA